MGSLSFPQGFKAFRDDQAHGGSGLVPGSLIKKLTFPSGAYITNSYDTNMAWLLSTVLKNSGNTTLNSHTHQVNSGGQRTKQTRADASYVDYTYDPIGQLKTALGKESGGTSRLHEQFGYRIALFVPFAARSLPRPSSLPPFGVLPPVRVIRLFRGHSFASFASFARPIHAPRRGTPHG